LLDLSRHFLKGISQGCRAEDGELALNPRHFGGHCSPAQGDQQSNDEYRDDQMAGVTFSHSRMSS
jgi:hypothetical protein